jgi:hypothetical protein
MKALADMSNQEGLKLHKVEGMTSNHLERAGEIVMPFSFA